MISHSSGKAKTTTKTTVRKGHQIKYQSNPHKSTSTTYLQGGIKDNIKNYN